MPSIQNCSSVTVHVSSERLIAVTGSLSLQVVRWVDGKSGAATAFPVSLNPQGGFSAVVDSDTMLKAVGCAARTDCFIVARLTKTAGGTELLAPVSYQWLTLWRDAALKPAQLTILSASPAGDEHTAGALNVTVSSDSVAPNVMVHCSQATDFGKFDTNGLLLMPGQPVTLLYTPQAFAPAGQHTPCTTASEFYAVSVNGLSKTGEALALKLDDEDLHASNTAASCTFVLPSATAPGITDVKPNGNSASKAKHVDPGHYACMPASRTPRGLMLFVPGLAAADYTMFAQEAAATGLAVVVISSAACSSECCTVDKALNCSARDAASIRAVEACSLKEKQMHLMGAPVNPGHYPTITPPNSIIGRLTALIKHLSSRNETFRALGAFLDEKGDPRWSNITAAGHSCASYYPLLLGTTFKLKRVVMVGGVGQPLNGWAPLRLPSENVYGFVRGTSPCSSAANNSGCAERCESCAGNQSCTFAADEGDYSLLKLPGQAGVELPAVQSGSDASLAQALGGARQLFDRGVCAFPGRPIMTHLCEICDLQTHRYANGTAVLAPVWRYLAANTLPTTAKALAASVTCNNTSS